MEAMHDAKRACEVLGNAGLRGRVSGPLDVVEVRPEARAANDDDIAHLIDSLACRWTGKVQVVQPATSCTVSMI